MLFKLKMDVNRKDLNGILGRKKSEIMLKSFLKNENSSKKITNDEKPKPF